MGEIWLQDQLIWPSPPPVTGVGCSLMTRDVAMKVAIATQDLARVDAHLGWARHLMIYEVSEEGWR